ncbi:GMC family oxidoreductase [Rhizobium sp. CECT 9324]|uniref:GMC oxidoreductase n=1 Tax=Rhizobium sp. CECT 9324 TaxID=2845820 RepID=UPI001E418579|nr:GMC family oxidoreductase [Rhizobium sp. CECT 9324]CAH0342920.1 2-methyl-1,2-propanediol dehydrogenase [Rhizobium sp. CECT 9324]
MGARDLRTAAKDTLYHADIAIVGAGPAGLAIARELAHTKLRVLIVESGGFEFDEVAQGLNRVDNIGEPKPRDAVGLPGRGYSDSLASLNDIPAFELRNRGVGGSTHTWVGKCAAFDEIDFEHRTWLPGSGWPVTRESLEPFLDRAGSLLNLGPNLYDARLQEHLRSPPVELGFDQSKLRSFFWQFSQQSASKREPFRFVEIARGLNAANIEILTHATVTRINVEPSGRAVTSLEVRSLSDHRALVQARTIVLCSGGVENARLLLASNSVMPQGVGNGSDVVGRYLADHPRTVIASFPSPALEPVARQFGFFGLTHRGQRHFYLHGLALSPAIQAREGLLNCAAYPVQTLSSNDPWAALKRMVRGSRTPGRDLLTVLRSPDLVVRGLYERQVLYRGLPRKSDELRFDVMVEQPPNPESRITLSSSTDRLGTPLARVDWRIGALERQSVKRLARLMQSEFKVAGLPEPRLADWILADDDQASAFMDMAHPSGTTRMGTDPATSVVDADSMVHGVDGLFVAGSSVFPTAGHANPTLMIVTLALRLADHLKRRAISYGMTVQAGTPNGQRSGEILPLAAAFDHKIREQ